MQLTVGYCWAVVFYVFDELCVDGIEQVFLDQLEIAGQGGLVFLVLFGGLVGIDA